MAEEIEEAPPIVHRELFDVTVPSGDVSSRLARFTAGAFNKARRNAGVLPSADESTPAARKPSIRPQPQPKARTLRKTTLAELVKARTKPNLLEQISEQENEDSRMEALEDVRIILVPRKGQVPSQTARKESVSRSVNAFRSLRTQ